MQFIVSKLAKSTVLAYCWNIDSLTSIQEFIFSAESGLATKARMRTFFLPIFQVLFLIRQTGLVFRFGQHYSKMGKWNTIKNTTAYK